MSQWLVGAGLVAMVGACSNSQPSPGAEASPVTTRVRSTTAPTARWLGAVRGG